MEDRITIKTIIIIIITLEGIMKVMGITINIIITIIRALLEGSNSSSSNRSINKTIILGKLIAVFIRTTKADLVQDSSNSKLTSRISIRATTTMIDIQITTKETFQTNQDSYHLRMELT